MTVRRIGDYVECDHPATYDSMPAVCTSCGAIEGMEEWKKRRDRFCSTWRTGTKVGNTIYFGNEFAGSAITPEVAARLVHDANVGRRRSGR